MRKTGRQESGAAELYARVYAPFIDIVTFSVVVVVVVSMGLWTLVKHERRNQYKNKYFLLLICCCFYKRPRVINKLAYYKHK